VYKNLPAAFWKQNVYLSSIKNNMERELLLSHLSSVLGAVSLSPFARHSSVHKIQPDKLNILCVGAHPGDPEFGCGGTMANIATPEMQ
jgi:hypothetical protein